jgi:hypothetical protein
MENTLRNINLLSDRRVQVVGQCLREAEFVNIHF